MCQINIIRRVKTICSLIKNISINSIDSFVHMNCIFFIFIILINFPLFSFSICYFSFIISFYLFFRIKPNSNVHRAH